MRWAAVAGLLAASALLALVPARAAEPGYDVAGEQCTTRQEYPLGGEVVAPVCAAVAASTTGGGVGTAVVSWVDPIRWGSLPSSSGTTIVLDCAVVEEYATGDRLFAAGTFGSSAQRGYLYADSHAVAEPAEAGHAPCGSADIEWAPLRPGAVGPPLVDQERAIQFVRKDPVPNALPTAVMHVGCTAASCTFDATGSRDSDGTIVQYRWYVQPRSGSQVTFRADPTFSLPNTDPQGYSVRLIVVDDRHGADENTGASPVAALAAPSCTDLTCTFDASASSDPDGHVIQYNWSFDDSVTTWSSDPTMSHTWGTYGDHTVSVTVSDDEWHSSAPVTRSFTLAKTPYTLSGAVAQQGRKVRVDLRWSGAGAGQVAVFRNSQRIATVTAGTTAYSDQVGSGTGKLTYQACDDGTARCSDQWSTTV